MTGSVPTTDPLESVLPPEELLECVLYEPRDDLLNSAKLDDQVRAIRQTFVAEARAVCVDPRETFVDGARQTALDPEPGGPTAPTLPVQFRDGTVDIKLSSDELLESLILIYSVEGWAGIRRISDTLDVELRQRLRPPAPDADQYGNRASEWALDLRNQSSDRSGFPQTFDYMGLPGALQSSDEGRREAEAERERWQQGKAAFDATRDLLALAVVNALARIEQHATDLLVLRLNRARNLAADLWRRYGVHKKVVSRETVHFATNPYEKVTYKFVLGQEDEKQEDEKQEDEKQKDEKNKLTEAVKALVDSLAEVQKIEQYYHNLWSAQGGAGTPSSPRPSLEEVFPQIREARASFVNILAVQSRAHPLASAVMLTLKPGFDDEALAWRVGTFLETVIESAERFEPTDSRIGRLGRERDDWTQVLDEGPEAWLVREAALDDSNLDPLTYEPLLTALLADERSVLDALEYVVLQNYLEALAADRERRQAEATAKAIGGVFIAIAQVTLNAAALFVPKLRPVALLVDSALAIEGALAALHAAAELEPGFRAEVEKQLVAVGKGATISDLSELGQVVADAPSAAEVALLLLKAGVSLRATAATLRILPTRRLAFLESLDFALGVM